jgi:hypothetical protein
MRLESEAPKNEIEFEIEKILIKNGFRPEDIQFGSTNYNNPYLRVGYWRRLDCVALQELGKLITAEVDDFDEDCGYLYSYNIRKI